MISRTIVVEGKELVPEVEPSWSALGRYGRANIAVTLGQAVGWAALLTVIDTRSSPWSVRAAALVLFCLMMQGVFTMMHEYFHRNAHASDPINYGIKMNNRLAHLMVEQAQGDFPPTKQS